MLNRRNLSLLIALAFVLSACNLPRATPTPQNAILTIAAQTIEAQKTQDALLKPPATFPPLATFTAIPLATATSSPAPTLTPTPLCDLAQFVQDVNVPDGTQFTTGQSFNKTWRLKNIGVCTWTSGYQLIFDSGDGMSGPAVQALAGAVAPGQTVDISVELKAPANAGQYRSYWKLRNSAGVLIPVANGYQGTAFFVDIKVVALTSTPTVTSTITPTVTATITTAP